MSATLRALAGLLAAGTAAASLVLGAGPAAAHTELERTEPADGAALDAGPGVVRLVFDEAVQGALATVVVTGPDGDAAQGAPQVVDATVDQPVSAGGAGDYRVAYRVVSADGHPITGEIGFTVAGAPEGAGDPAPGAAPDVLPEAPPATSPATSLAQAPASQASPRPTAVAAADDGGLHAQHLVPLAAVAAAAVVVVGVTTWTRRGERRGS